MTPYIAVNMTAFASVIGIGLELSEGRCHNKKLLHPFLHRFHSSGLISCQVR